MKSKREFGITIIELLSCIVILAILASLLFPVFSRAKLESKTAAAKLNLKQLHLTLTLYRLDYEGVEYGDIASMGFPDTAQPGGSPLMELIRKTSGPDYKRQSPCGYHPRSKDNTFHYYPSSPSDWNKWVNKLESRTILLGDANCNTADVEIEDQFARKRCLGVALDGHVTSIWNDQVPYWTQDFFLRGNQ